MFSQARPLATVRLQTVYMNKTDVLCFPISGQFRKSGTTKKKWTGDTLSQLEMAPSARNDGQYSCEERAGWEDDEGFTHQGCSLVKILVDENSLRFFERKSRRCITALNGLARRPLEFFL